MKQPKLDIKILNDDKIKQNKQKNIKQTSNKSDWLRQSIRKIKNFNYSKINSRTARITKKNNIAIGN